MNKNGRISLLVDGREKGEVISTFRSNVSNMEVRNLAVGDFWICKNLDLNVNLDNNSNGGSEDIELTPDIVEDNNDTEILVILERKTWNDYVCSLESKHIYNQRGRLLKCKNVITGFIIEGKRNKRVGYKKRDRSQVEKFLLHSQLRDNLNVFYTDDLDDTTELIKHFMNKLKDPKFLNNKNHGMMYEDCVKLDKKSNLTAETCYLSQLSQIPGVSTNVARLIATKYKTMTHLCVRIYENRKKVMKRISDLKTESETGKKRRIGAVKATKIIEFLTNKQFK